MNKSLSLNLKFNPAAILSWLRKAQPLLIGVGLIGVFAFTAHVVNAALNVTPVTPDAKSLGVSFDKPTLDSLKTLTNVSSTVSSQPLGKTDPFGNN